MEPIYQIGYALRAYIDLPKNAITAMFIDANPLLQNYQHSSAAFLEDSAKPYIATNVWFEPPSGPMVSYFITDIVEALLENGDIITF